MKTLMNKMIACISAAALTLGLLPASAIALTESDLIGESATYTGTGTQEVSTDINLVTYGGLTVVPADEQFLEEDYSTGAPITVWVSGASSAEQAPSGTWKWAPAAYKNNGNPDFESAYAKATVLAPASTDGATYDTESRCWAFTHIPRADGLAPDATYWYWLDVADGSGLTASTAQQAKDDPYVVVRESGYKPGPFLDGPSGEWTFALAGVGVDKIDGHILDTNDAAGSIKIGSTIYTSPLFATDSSYKALVQAAGTTMATEGAWSVSVRDVVPEEADAYISAPIMVAINAADIEWPEGATAPIPGTSFEVLRIDPTTSKVIKLSSDAAYGLTYHESGLITFYVSDSGKTGDIGTYSLAIAQTSQDANRAFEIATSAGENGTISGGGSYAYGTAPTFTFEPTTQGYETDTLTLSIYSKKGDSAPKKTVNIKNKNASEGDSSYGTWEGNSYTLPATFNENKDEPYAVLTVAFKYKQDTDPETPVKLTVKATGPGSVYVGSNLPETCVSEAEKVFTTGQTYGTYTLEKNKAVDLIFASDTNARVKSLTIAGQNFEGIDASYQISKLTEDTVVEVVFEYGTIVVPDHTVSAVYDKTKARVGFGETSTTWADSTTVADKGSVTMLVRPLSGFAVESAKLFYGDVEGADVTEAAKAGLIQIDNVVRDTQVRFTFATLEASFTLSTVVPGSTVKDASGKVLAAGAALTASGEADATLTIVLDAGKTLDMNSVKLTGSAGAVSPQIAGPSTVGGKQEYSVTVSYQNVADAGAGATLSYALKDGGSTGSDNPPTPADPELPGGTTLPGNNGDGKLEGGSVVAADTNGDGKADSVAYVPEEDNGVVDTIVVDGVTVLDEWGVELKDTMDGPDSSGILTDPATGVRFDTTTGEYITPDGNRYTVNAEAGQVTITSSDRDLKPTGSFATTLNLTVNVVPKVEASDGGSVLPAGVFTWKRNLPLIIISAPENGKWLNTLEVDGVEWEHVPATQSHVDQLNNTLATIDYLNGATKSRMRNVSRQTDLMPAVQNVNNTVTLQRTIAALTGAEVAHAAPDNIVLTEGMRAAVVPADYFTGNNPSVSVRADFGEREYNISARIDGGHGRIAGTSSSDETFTVKYLQAGSSYTLNYEADNGYRVVGVTDNGVAATGFTQTSYKVNNIADDHEIVVTIKPVSALPAGATDPVSRTIRRLTSLAQTGDLNLPGMVGLLGIACAAVGVVVISSSRRKESKTAIHAEK
ncbi:hypothetical protein [Adlercreutzia sp. ZJ304]|uniref:hypothetical protein n=1 Tax=Adlercreutzia sp. ZJ304 TaxID=2709791 RepID=UPI0013EB33B2|nr:hypothetical protein [Adlercreutzia sp. ZJ304]